MPIGDPTITPPSGAHSETVSNYAAFQATTPGTLAWASAWIVFLESYLKYEFDKKAGPCERDWDSCDEYTTDSPDVPTQIEYKEAWGDYLSCCIGTYADAILNGWDCDKIEAKLFACCVAYGNAVALLGGP